MSGGHGARGMTAGTVPLGRTTPAGGNERKSVPGSPSKKISPQRHKDTKVVLLECPSGKSACVHAARKIFNTEFTENHGGARRLPPGNGHGARWFPSPCASVILRELRVKAFRRWKHTRTFRTDTEKGFVSLGLCGAIRGLSRGMAPDRSLRPDHGLTDAACHDTAGQRLFLPSVPPAPMRAIAP